MNTITLKLYASLGDYLPSTAQRNQVHLTVVDNLTPQKLIENYKIPPQMAHLVLINGTYLTPDKRDNYRLQAGDTIAIWPPVAGG